MPRYNEYRVPNNNNNNKYRVLLFKHKCFSKLIRLQRDIGESIELLVISLPGQISTHFKCLT